MSFWLYCYLLEIFGRMCDLIFFSYSCGCRYSRPILHEPTCQKPKFWPKIGKRVNFYQTWVAYVFWVSERERICIIFFSNPKWRRPKLGQLGAKLEWKLSKKDYHIDSRFSTQHCFKLLSTSVDEFLSKFGIQYGGSSNKRKQ